MESIILRVTPSIVIGITAAIRRKSTLDATTPGAASHTILKMGGTFFSELTRSRQLGLAGGGASFIGVSMRDSRSWGPAFDAISGCYLISHIRDLVICCLSARRGGVSWGSDPN